MTFDSTFFENIHMTEVLGKFYRKEEVESLLKEISARVELQNKENELLQLKLENAERTARDTVREMEDRSEATRTLAQAMIADAQAEADKMTEETENSIAAVISAAEKEASCILQEAKESAEQDIARGQEEREKIVSDILAAKEDLLAEIAASFGKFLRYDFDAGEIPEEPAAEPEEEPVDVLNRVLTAEEPEEEPAPEEPEESCGCGESAAECAEEPETEAAPWSEILEELPAVESVEELPAEEPALEEPVEEISTEEPIEELPIEEPKAEPEAEEQDEAPAEEAQNGGKPEETSLSDLKGALFDEPRRSDLEEKINAIARELDEIVNRGGSF